MMRGVPLETCWAFNKLWNNKLYYKAASCWYFYWIIHDARIHKYKKIWSKIDIGIYVKHPLLLSDFNQKGISSTDFHKSPQYQIWCKSVRWKPRWHKRTAKTNLTGPSHEYAKSLTIARTRSNTFSNKNVSIYRKLTSPLRGTLLAAQLVEALRYKPEGRGFYSRLCHWNFSLTQSFRPHYGPGVDSASNKN
jgi:hypothetical protein